MSVRRASSQLLAQRSVHIRIVPRPANLGESREIFRILQRFGEMTVYKHLRYEYHSPADNIALAIYREADSAAQAIQSSPIRFSIDAVLKEGEGQEQEHEQEQDHEDREDKNPFVSNTPVKDGIDEMLKPSSLANRATSTSLSTGDPLSTTPPTKDPLNPTLSAPPPMPFALNPSTTARTPHKKYFQITLDRSRVVHQDFVERQPYWKQFEPMKSMAQIDLAKKVPHVGLSDVSKRPRGAHRTPNKILKNMSNYLKLGMPNLMEMYEEGAREEKKVDRAP